MHEVLGNMPEAWNIAADDLLWASHILRTHTAPLPSESGTIYDDDDDEFRVLPPELLLRGLAIEVYFKAIWTTRGNKLVVNSEYSRIPDAGQHNLLQIAEVLTLPFTPVQRDLLVRLSEYIDYAGRYPIPKRAEQLSSAALASLVGQMGTYWSIPADDATFDSIMVIISHALGRRSPTKA